jgi:hypothetical protein
LPRITRFSENGGGTLKIGGGECQRWKRAAAAAAADLFVESEKRRARNLLEETAEGHF